MHRTSDYADKVERVSKARDREIYVCSWAGSFP